jgi:hypothetical protein
VTPSLSLAQSGSGQGGNRSVPKKEREIHGVDFRVVNGLFPRVNLTFIAGICTTLWAQRCHPDNHFRGDESRTHRSMTVSLVRVLKLELLFPDSLHEARRKEAAKRVERDWLTTATRRKYCRAFQRCLEEIDEAPSVILVIA